MEKQKVPMTIAECTLEDEMQMLFRSALSAVRYEQSVIRAINEGRAVKVVDHNGVVHIEWRSK